MTNDEINSRLAEMMEGEISQAIVGLLPTCDNKSYRWNPYSNIEHARMCEAKIVADIPCSDGDHYFFDLRHVAEVYIARFQHPLACLIDGDEENEEMGFEYFLAEHKNPATAISLACIAVLDKGNWGKRSYKPRAVDAEDVEE